MLKIIIILNHRMAPEVAAVERTGGYDQMVSDCIDRFFLL